MALKMSREAFRGGVDLPYFKVLTAEHEITELPRPDSLIISLKQHIGSPCKSLVKEGDRVERGQKIGEQEGQISAPVHATYSGEVTAVKKHPGIMGEYVESIEIRVDEEQPKNFTEPVRNLYEVTPEEIIEIVQQARPLPGGCRQ